MVEKKIRITGYTDEIAHHPQYVKNESELDRLLDAIISRTSAVNMKFNRIEVMDHTDSSRSDKDTEIGVTADRRGSRFAVKILLRGCSERWLVYIYYTKGIQQNISGFLKEMVAAAKAVCEEENAKHIPEVGQASLLPNGSGDVVKPIPGPLPAPGKQRKRRVMTESIITDGIKLDILEAFLRRTAGLPRIDQKEFWEVLDGLNITVNKILVLNLLTKKDLLKISVPVVRHPIVEITKLGLDWLTERKRRSGAAEIEKEKEMKLQKILAFQKESLPQLENFQNLLSAYAELRQLEQDRVDIPKQIVALQKKLEGLDQEEKNCLEKIKQLLSQASQDEISGLIEIAQQATQPKES